MNLQRKILQEIANPNRSQYNIAQLYALALHDSSTIDWPTINKAIMARWPDSLYSIQQGGV